MAVDQPIQNEQWLPIPGYEGLYEVSDHGRVRSLGRSFTRRDGRKYTRGSRMLRPVAKTSGHLTVRLYGVGGQSEWIMIHRLVAYAFIGPCPPGALVLHWNDVPDDNRAENLRFGSYTDNQVDAVRNGRNGSTKKTHCPQGHEYTPENTAIYGGSRCCLTCTRKNRRENARKYRARRGHSRKSRCRNGHEFTPETTGYTPTGRRRCLECARDRAMRHQQS